MKILIISNIPSPYRIDFFNELGKYVKLVVIFEAKESEGITFNWNIDSIKNFEAIFLKEGNINEKKVNWKIIKYLKKDQYDQIIVTSYAYYTEMLAVLILKALRIPYFLEVDGGLIRQESKVKKKLKSFLISNAKGYFSPSQSSDDYLIYYGADIKSIFRYPFTSLVNEDILKQQVTSEEKKKLREKLAIKEDLIILSVGQFIHRKGFDILIEASRHLNKNIGIYILGGKPTNEYINLKNKYKLSNIHFIDFQTKDELQNYFKSVDLFVLPTREDVWGLVINEAMACGLPIITTNKCVAGLELVIPRVNGFIVETEDVDDIFKKINIILTDEKLKNKMGQNSLNIIKNYTIEEMVIQHLKVFQN